MSVSLSYKLLTSKIMDVIIRGKFLVLAYLRNSMSREFFALEHMNINMSCIFMPSELMCVIIYVKFLMVGYRPGAPL